MKLYYRMRNDYLKNQNLFHRPFITLIQKVYRGHACRLQAHKIALNKAVFQIQRIWATFQIVKKSKLIVRDLKMIKLAEQKFNLLQINSANLITKTFRGLYHKFYFDFISVFIIGLL